MNAVVRQLTIATVFTVVTTAIFGLGYPLLVTAAAQILFESQANGSIVERGGVRHRLRPDRPAVLGTWILLAAAICGRQGLRRDRVGRVEPRPNERDADFEGRDRTAAARGYQRRSSGAGRTGDHVGFRP